MRTDNWTSYEWQVMKYFARHGGRHSMREIIEGTESLLTLFNEFPDMELDIPSENREVGNIWTAVHNLVRKGALTQDGRMYYVPVRSKIRYIDIYRKTQTPKLRGRLRSFTQSLKWYNIIVGVVGFVAALMSIYQFLTLP